MGSLSHSRERVIWATIPSASDCGTGVSEEGGADSDQLAEGRERTDATISADELARAERARGRLYLRAAEFFETYDLLITPATIVSPFADTPVASVEKIPAGRSPSPSMPPARRQRCASLPDEDELYPTTVPPSAEMREPWLR